LERVNTIAADREAAAGLLSAAIQLEVGGLDLRQVIAGGEAHRDVVVVPARRRVGAGRRSGAVDLDAADRRVGGVAGLITDGGAVGKVRALACHCAIGRACAGDPGEAIAARPVIRRGAVVPAVAVGRCRGRSAERWRGLVDFNAGGASAGAVTGGVGSRAAGALVIAFA